MLKKSWAEKVFEGVENLVVALFLGIFPFLITLFVLFLLTEFLMQKGGPEFTNQVIAFAWSWKGYSVVCLGIFIYILFDESGITRFKKRRKRKIL